MTVRPAEDFSGGINTVPLKILCEVTGKISIKPCGYISTASDLKTPRVGLERQLSD